MVFIIFSFVSLGVGFLTGFVPIIGPMLLGAGVAAYIWKLQRRAPDESLTNDGRFFFVMMILGLLVHGFVFFEPDPGMALYRPVPGMMFTQVTAFLIAFLFVRSPRL
jgi:hypothetical protein